MITVSKQDKLLFLLSLLIISIYVYLQVSHFLKIPEPQLFPDSSRYLKSGDIMTEQIPPEGVLPVVPLINKILHNDIEAIVLFQLVFSICSWIFLSLAVAISLKNYVVKIFTCIIILAFSLSKDILMWNKTILSESFSLSIFACFVGIWFLIFKKVTLKRLIMLIIISAIFALTRNSNAYLLLALGGIITVTAFIYRLPNKRIYYMTLVIVFFLLFFVSDLISNATKQWTLSFLNVLSMRILPDREMTAYFESSGMPVNENLMARSGKWCYEDDYAFYNAPELQQFRKWLYSQGKSTYTRYLLSHPKYLILKPLEDIKLMLYGERLIYYAPKGFSTPIRGIMYDLVSSWTLFPAYIFFVGVLFGLNCALVFSGKSIISLIPLIMILLVFPLAALVWHADALEIDRHVLPIAVQARLGFILLILITIDMIPFHRVSVNS